MAQPRRRGCGSSGASGQWLEQLTHRQLGLAAAERPVAAVAVARDCIRYGRRTAPGFSGVRYDLAHFSAFERNRIGNHCSDPIANATGGLLGLEDEH